MVDSPVRMILLVGIVTYNPADEILDIIDQNLNVLGSRWGEVVVLDNGSRNAAEIAACADQRATLICNDENIGIASAYNQLFQYAINQGHEWVITLDQDSEIPTSMIQVYQAFIDSIDEGDKLGIICPVMFDKNRREWFGTEGFVSSCISSGSCCAVTAWKAIGGFDDYLFIDEVDHDYCNRLTDGGWHIYRTDLVEMSHEIGRSEEKRILGCNIVVWHHPPVRHYYQIRNKIYLRAKSKERYLSYAFERLLICVIRVGLFEDRKLEKTRALCRGCGDGLRKARRISA